MVGRKFLSWRIKVKVRKKGFRMQRYIFEIRKGKKILGYEIKIGEMGFNQSFLYKDYHDPRFVAEAICLNNMVVECGKLNAVVEKLQFVQLEIFREFFMGIIGIRAKIVEVYLGQLLQLEQLLQTVIK